TVETPITHTVRWTIRAMAYQGLWVPGGRPKKVLKKSSKKRKIQGSDIHCSAILLLTLKPMGFAPQGLWVTGYRGLMGYGVQIPAHQLGGPKKAWDFRGYGLSEAWVMGVSTVTTCLLPPTFPT
ncbi:hypothetical protein K443DRAFT_61317, partial [Laccaria amethystina LaAM-08-1]